MPYYRIDKRNFNVGDIIISNAAFIKNINANDIWVENLLENNRPEDKPNRNEVVKLFDSKEAAIKYWILDTNSKFYEVELIGEILHRGNYDLVTEIYKETDEDTKTQKAIQYWNEENIGNCIIENYVNSARVISIISNDEKERKNTRNNHYGQLTIPNIRVIK